MGELVAQAHSALVLFGVADRHVIEHGRVVYTATPRGLDFLAARDVEAAVACLSAL